MVASATFLQSINQNRALTWDRDMLTDQRCWALLGLTVVVKLTQSLTKFSGVLPVTSSHWARVVPPGNIKAGLVTTGGDNTAAVAAIHLVNNGQL